VARAAEELTFPRDLRREGTSKTNASREKLLRAFGMEPGQVNEVQRLTFRKQLEARLGLRATSDRELKLAAVMDQLRQQDPTATRLQLRAAAERALRRVSVQQPPPELQAPLG